jgi:hypothetical protein
MQQDNLTPHHKEKNMVTTGIMVLHVVLQTLFYSSGPNYRGVDLHGHHLYMGANAPAACARDKSEVETIFANDVSYKVTVFCLPATPADLN